MVAVCPITSKQVDALITPVRRTWIGEQAIGRVSDEEIVRLTTSMAVYLGIG